MNAGTTRPRRSKIDHMCLEHDGISVRLQVSSLTEPVVATLDRVSSELVLD